MPASKTGTLTASEHAALLAQKASLEVKLRILHKEIRLLERVVQAREARVEAMERQMLRHLTEGPSNQNCPARRSDGQPGFEDDPRATKPRTTNHLLEYDDDSGVVSDGTSLDG